MVLGKPRHRSQRLAGDLFCSKVNVGMDLVLFVVLLLLSLSGILVRCAELDSDSTALLYSCW